MGLISPAPPWLRRRGHTWVDSDFFEISDRIEREVDPNLDLDINDETGCYEIWYHNPSDGGTYLVRTLPRTNPDGTPFKLTPHIVEELKEYDSAGRNALSWRDIVRLKEEARAREEREREEAWAAAHKEMEERLLAEAPELFDEVRPVFFNAKKQKGASE